MSPEQAAGDLERTGTTSDVYSLGATLFCLMTGRAPFEGDVGQVLRNVQQGEFPRPRQADATIPAALEAVCLKAMAREPDDRYHSARSMADDIERWAADEPVWAYREPWRARLARWERRNKPLVYAASISLVVSVLVLAVATAFIANARDQKEAERLRAQESLEKAEASFQLAVNANDQVISRFADANLNAIPGMQKIRMNLADMAVGQFEDFRKVRPDDVKLAVRSVRIYHNAALPHLIVGDFQTAATQYAAAVRAIEGFGLRKDAAETERWVLAGAYRHYATFNAEVGRDKFAEENFEKSYQIWDSLRKGASKNPRFMKEVGWLMSRWGEHQYQFGDRDRARKSAAMAVEMLTPVMNKPGEWN